MDKAKPYALTKRVTKSNQVVFDEAVYRKFLKEDMKAWKKVNEEVEILSHRVEELENLIKEFMQNKH